MTYAILPTILGLKNKCRSLLTLLIFIVFVSTIAVNNMAQSSSTIQTSSDIAIEKTKPPLIISYPRSKTQVAIEREKYFIALLKLALSKAELVYELRPVDIGYMVETRSARLLEEGIHSIGWLHTNREFEQFITPARIPLFKGLIGWRLLLIREESIDTFKGINSLQELLKYRTLQGDGWPDTKILKDNGFLVETSHDYRSLFRMLKYGRGDFFPRGIFETWAELSAYPELNLVAEKHLALYYPTAYYFFFPKEDNYLRNAVERGLMMAIKDGSFDKIFMQYFGEVLKKSNLEKRTILHLKNNTIPELMPLERKELWFSPPNTDK